MPKSFIHYTFLFFVLTALSGAGLRSYAFLKNSSLPYDHLLHAHSHIAILGWTFLGAFAIFLKVYWKQIKQKTEARILMLTLLIATSLMFIAFLYQGYDMYSIIFSVLHIFIEYWVITFIYRILKDLQMVPKATKWFIYASLISLFISTIGPFSLGYIASAGLKDSYWFDIAIYFYLHFQYNGWLFLILIGLFIAILKFKRITYNHTLLLKGFWLYIIALLPSFFASVLWVNAGRWMDYLAILGTIGQWAAILCILFSFKNIKHQLQKKEKPLTIKLLLVVFIILFLKSTMELGLLLPNLGALVFETRSVVIGYLHFTLLGFVSLFILIQFRLTHVLTSDRFAGCGFVLFIAGLLLNELLLFSQGLLDWLHLGTVPGYSIMLLLASILLLTGVITLWKATSKHG